VTEGDLGTDRWLSSVLGADRNVFINDKDGRFNARVGYSTIFGAGVYYTLADTAAEPVPEPITVAGTALALAGLSWLKYKQHKMAV
jgi:hypothetical protein